MVSDTMRLYKSLFLLLSGFQIGHASLRVTSPEKNTTVVAGRTFTVEWDPSGGNSRRFVIDLYNEQSYSVGESEMSCGEWVTALCPYGENGCPDSTGDYDIVFPEPMTVYAKRSRYRIGVLGIEDGSFGCSEEFTLLAEGEVAKHSDEYFLNVTAPVDGDEVVAGHMYDVEFTYENGVGSTTDRFDIDLFTIDENGGCGTYVTALCDKWIVGCKDSDGSHRVTIPLDTDFGFYRIRVATFEDPSIFDCSGVFEVVKEYSFSHNYEM